MNKLKKELRNMPDDELVSWLNQWRLDLDGERLGEDFILHLREAAYRIYQRPDAGKIALKQVIKFCKGQSEGKSKIVVWVYSGVIAHCGRLQATSKRVG